MEIKVFHAEELREMADKANESFAEDRYHKLREEYIPKFIRAAKAGQYSFKIIVESADCIIIKSWERFSDELTLAGYTTDFIWYDDKRELSSVTVSWVEKFKKF